MGLLKRSTYFFFVLCIATGALSCSELVEQTTFTKQGALDWKVLIKEAGKYQLRLGYDVNTPLGRRASGKNEEVFDIEGTATIEVGGKTMYNGPLWISSRSGPTTKNSLSYTSTSSSTSGNRSDLSRTTKMYDLGSLAAGSELRVNCRVPMKDESTTVSKVWIELRR